MGYKNEDMGMVVVRDMGCLGGMERWNTDKVADDVARATSTNA